MHHHAYRFVQRIAGELGHVRRILEIGSRNINGSVRPLFPALGYVGIDLVAGSGVDIVADGATFVPVAPPECIVCCEVLEHTAQAEALVGHALDLLPPGGHLLVTCAAPDRAPHSAVDGGALRAGEYYANVAPADLVVWVQRHHGTITRLEHHQGRGDVYLWAVKQ
jgi:hypothetical protein